jgi:hypothetical protein
MKASINENFYDAGRKECRPDPVIIFTMSDIVPHGAAKDELGYSTFVAGAFRSTSFISAATYPGSRRIRWLSRSGVGSRPGFGTPRERDLGGRSKASLAVFRDRPTDPEDRGASAPGSVYARTGPPSASPET